MGLGLRDNEGNQRRKMKVADASAEGVRADIPLSPENKGSRTLSEHQGKGMGEGLSVKMLSKGGILWEKSTQTHRAAVLAKVHSHLTSSKANISRF